MIGMPHETSRMVVLYAYDSLRYLDLVPGSMRRRAGPSRTDGSSRASGTPRRRRAAGSGGSAGSDAARSYGRYRCERLGVSLSTRCCWHRYQSPSFNVMLYRIYDIVGVAISCGKFKRDITVLRACILRRRLQRRGKFRPLGLGRRVCGGLLDTLGPQPATQSSYTVM